MPVKSMTMMIDLSSAQSLANKVRYTGDKSVGSSIENRSPTDQAQDQLLREGLYISDFVTPNLAKGLQQVCIRLNVPRECLSAFVYSSSEFQASCIATDLTKCVIRFSSQLIDLLGEDEFEFVCGHELGHFLLGHGLLSPENSGNSLEYFIQQRSHEISADRIGLLACGSLETAIRAMMKTISGLSDEHLRFDVSAFIGQIRKTGETQHFYYDYTSHPSLVIRCRALLWFSMSEKFFEAKGETGGEPHEKIEDLIQAELDKYINEGAKQRIEDARIVAKVWLSACASIRNGALDKKDQEIIGRLVGDDKLEKLKNLYEGCSPQEVVNLTREKLINSFSQFEHLAPVEFQNSITALCGKIGNDFGQSDFEAYLKDYLSEGMPNSSL